MRSQEKWLLEVEMVVQSGKCVDANGARNCMQESKDQEFKFCRVQFWRHEMSCSIDRHESPKAASTATLLAMLIYVVELYCMI